MKNALFEGVLVFGSIFSIKPIVKTDYLFFSYLCSILQEFFLAALNQQKQVKSKV
ncbi:hypothetical protein PTUN_a1347 [Pseudoalteromonas tunicata]|uniref:Uncharacterized protein n=1 Tax=Pseudoalteromonas tunicata D2 TaxID=87626 RepID=A4CD36_9GAMM|nr:hypothetical protein PTUN_a1347 [Pseudoalteromonas tunicata]EAR27479.1 hypothetical protein PTD2_15607 [Pseudoalteromonas tunicata D2]